MMLELETNCDERTHHEDANENGQDLHDAHCSANIEGLAVAAICARAGGVALGGVRAYAGLAHPGRYVRERSLGAIGVRQAARRV